MKWCCDLHTSYFTLTKPLSSHAFIKIEFRLVPYLILRCQEGLQARSWKRIQGGYLQVLAEGTYICKLWWVFVALLLFFSADYVLHLLVFNHLIYVALIWSFSIFMWSYFTHLSFFSPRNHWRTIFISDWLWHIRW